MQVFKQLPDPRTTFRGNLQHPLTDMLFMVIAAVISGANSWKDIEAFGHAQLDWLRKFVPLQAGVPSHDTLGRVFAKLDHQAFSQLFTQWVSAIGPLPSGEIIAIDGKRLRGSYDNNSARNAIHIVSAFAANQQLCAGQVACGSKENEITAIPKLLEEIAIQGCTVSIDAIGCQKDIAETICKKDADYILAVKNNQPDLLQQVEKLFQRPGKKQENTAVDIGHGRVETRHCQVINDLRFLDGSEQWQGLKSIIKVEARRYHKTTGKEEAQTRYYISSLSANAARFNQYIRSHWGVENRLHWQLDTLFKEDYSRRRKGNSPFNFNIIAKIALSMINQAKTTKEQAAAIRMKAGWDYKLREKLLYF